jgi:general secretion pathway protein K
MTKRRAFRRRFFRANRRGIALILVLGSLTILTVFLTEAQNESAADLAGALSARDQLVGEYAAKSAVNLSRLVIAAEPTIRMAIGPLLALMNQGQIPGQIPVWEHADKALGAFNDEIGQKAFSALASVDTKSGKNLGIEGARFEVRIIDEDSKIDVNSPARGEAFSEIKVANQLMGLMMSPSNDPLFSQRDADNQFSDRQQICSAIIDWADPNQDQASCDVGSDNAQAAAPEDSFYSLLDRPYERKNAAFDSLEELRRVRGMSEDFWATFIEPDPEAPDKRVVTVWGQGTVNVNTANPQVVLTLVCQPNAAPDAPICVDPVESAKFLSVFSIVRSVTAGAPIFGSPTAFINALQGKGMFGSIMEMIQLQPVQFKSADSLKKSIATESKVFSIYATGYVGNERRESSTRIHAVVDFRGAPPPGVSAQALELAKDQAAALDPTGTAAQQIEAALKPSPGGNIVYYRVD